ncbi:hypothetical protein [Mesorhizobium sp. ORM16]|uniref:hypothetical protein n=1 Tax=Mesorhizobium sp. ORM16 TaxID=3376989 RepID=UPI00385773FB
MMLYVAAQLHPKVVSDLELKRYGLRSFKADYRMFRPVDQKRSMMVGGDTKQMQAVLARFSKADAARYPEFRKYLSGVSEFVHDLKLQTPIDIVATSLSSRLKTASFLWGHRNVGGDFYKLIDLFTQSSDEYLSRWFESSEVKAAFAFAVGGSLIGPKTPGSAWPALHGGSTGWVPCKLNIACEKAPQFSSFNKQDAGMGSPTDRSDRSRHGISRTGLTCH